MNRLAIAAIAAVVVLVLFMSSIFVVDEREKALVLQFGQIARVEETPGLKFKFPLIQNVVTYDDRILALDTPAIEVTPSDDRRLVVDAFARYRIADVVRLRQATGAGGLRAAEQRLQGILNPQIRVVLGADGVTSNTILSADRSVLMEQIRDRARAQALALGIEIVDVRLKQTALPEQNLSATFDRMRAEREREAADEVARGEEAAQRVRAAADRTVVELVSEARREGEITRGEADAARSNIFAEAFSSDPEFFEFYRSLAAYQRSLQGGNSTLVLSPDSDFFDYLKSDQPRDGVTSTTRRADEAARLTDEAAAAAGDPQDDANLTEGVDDGTTGAVANPEPPADGAPGAASVADGDTDSDPSGEVIIDEAEEAADADVLTTTVPIQSN